MKADRPVYVARVALQPHIGMGWSKTAKLFVLAGPVGAYYATSAGLHPITLLADADFIRAFPGGSGSVKMGWFTHPRLISPHLLPCSSMRIMLSRSDLAIVSMRFPSIGVWSGGRK